MVKLDDADINKSVEISDIAFGRGYLHHDELKAWNHDDRFTVLKAIGTTDDGGDEVAGFAVGSIMWREDAAQFLKVDGSIFGAEDVENIGIVKMTVVNPDFQKQHVGSSLVQALLQSLKMMGAQVYACVAWRQNNGVENIEPLIARHGFKSMLVIRDYWYQDSINEGYQCPADGNPCHCSADIWIRK